jgi:magnesium transporter
MSKASQQRFKRLYRRDRLLPERPGAGPSEIQVMAYGPDSLDERKVSSVAEIHDVCGRHDVTWINVDGPADPKTVEEAGRLLGLHSLALEDVMNASQRPKLDEYADHDFIVLRIPIGPDRAETEQIGLFLGKNYVLTFGERPSDCFDGLRAQVRNPTSPVRQGGADHLAYALMDAAIDAFFPVLESFGEALEIVEETILQKRRPDLFRRIHELKQDMMSLRRVAWSHRDLANKIVRDGTPRFTQPVRLFVRDCYDHAVQQIDLVETYREVSFSLIEIYQTAMTTRLNEIMKVLTMIATIFMPLSFIAGVYGMNFETSSPFNMPELHWRWGYLFALGLMGAVAAIMLFYFRRVGWIGDRDGQR